MIEQISRMAFPDWLMSLTAESMIAAPLPLHDILQDSLYYPGAGTDGKPVCWLAGNVYSFVYTDYMVSRSHFLETLNDEQTGFRGYHVLGSRDINEKELTPKGWLPIPPSHIDGNPNAWREHFARPFASWVVME